MTQLSSRPCKHNTVSLRGHAPAGGCTVHRGPSPFLYMHLHDFSNEDEAGESNSDRSVISSISGLLPPCYVYPSLHTNSIRFQDFQTGTAAALHKFPNFLDHLLVVGWGCPHMKDQFSRFYWQWESLGTSTQNTGRRNKAVKLKASSPPARHKDSPAHRQRALRSFPAFEWLSFSPGCEAPDTLSSPRPPGKVSVCPCDKTILRFPSKYCSRLHPIPYEITPDDSIWHQAHQLS